MYYFLIKHRHLTNQNYIYFCHIFGLTAKKIIIYYKIVPIYNKMLTVFVKIYQNDVL